MLKIDVNLYFDNNYKVLKPPRFLIIVGNFHRKLEINRMILTGKNKEWTNF